MWGYSLGERLNGIQEVSGSIPLSSTTPESRSRFSGFFIQSLCFYRWESPAPDSTDEDPANPSQTTTQNDAGYLLGDDAGNTDLGTHFSTDGGLANIRADAGFTLPSPCTPENTRDTDVESSSALQPQDGGAPILCVDATVKIKESSLRNSF